MWDTEKPGMLHKHLPCTSEHRLWPDAPYPGTASQFLTNVAMLQPLSEFRRQQSEAFYLGISQHGIVQIKIV